MPPFDPFNGEGPLAAMIRLANERDHSWRYTKKGDKRPAYDIEAAKQGRAKALQAKRDAAADRMQAETTLKATTARAGVAGQDIASRMLRAMESGQWYGAGDLMRMTGEGRTSRSKVRLVLLKRGWVEVGANPAYSGAKLSPWEIMGGAEPEPEWLYRLTAAGLARRAVIAP